MRGRGALLPADIGESLGVYFWPSSALHCGEGWGALFQLERIISLIVPYLCWPGGPVFPMPSIRAEYTVPAAEFSL